MTLNPPAPVPPQRRGWRGFLTLFLMLLALIGGFWLGGGGQVFANSGGGGTCYSNWVEISHTSSGCTYTRHETSTNTSCGGGSLSCFSPAGYSYCGAYCAPLSGGGGGGGGGGTSCNPNTIQYCWASPTCGGDNATNGCGNAVYSSSCNSGCGGGGPTCTPTGGNTTNFLGCDGSCKSGNYDQTNSCGTVTVAKYQSYAGGCTSAADGCGSTVCTPSGTNTTKFLGCDGTCKQGTFAQVNSCGAYASGSPYTSYAGGCTTSADGCGSTTPPPTCNGGTVSNGVCTCPSGDTLVNGTCQAPTTTTCPSGESLVNGVCTASCTAPPSSSTANGPYITGCASQGEYSTITYHTTVSWSCPGPTSQTTKSSSTGTQATSDCQPVIKIDGTKPLACAAAPDTGSAWSSYTYQHCLSYLGNAVNCGPTLTYTPPTPYQAQGGQFPEPVYNPVACPVPIAVGP